MKLDIILITYNQEQYIAQAVESVLMQRVNDDVQVRVIVADDCSYDNTLDIIKSYEEKSPFQFLYLPTEKNMGHVRNYQRAFAACDGDYVAIIEGDDWWTSPEHIQFHTDFLELHLECVLSANSPAMYVNEKQSFEIPYVPLEMQYDYMYIDGRMESRYNRITNLSSCIIRASALRRLNPNIYTLRVLDWALYICLTQYGLLCRHRFTTSAYRINENGIWSGKSEKEQSKLILDMILGFQAIYENLYTKELNEYKSECLETLTNKPIQVKKNIITKVLCRLKKLFV